MEVVIFTATLMFLMLFLVFLIYYKTSRYRKSAILVLRVRPIIKVLSAAIGVLAMWMALDFPYAWILIGYILSFVLVPFSTDVVVGERGLYFGLSLIPWDKIKNICDHSFYLMIATNQRIRRKGFLKVIWRISRQDVEQIRFFLKKIETEDVRR